MAQRRDCKCPIVRAAPTGVAAHGINGRTMHALFRLPVGPTKKSLTEPNVPVLQSLQGQFDGIHYIVLDEKSMINLQQLSWIDQRCRNIFPGRKSELFGGLSVILAGDFSQMPPIGSKPLYFSGPLQSSEEIHGRNAYQQFNCTIELDVIRRQEGNDDESNAFKQALDNLRDQSVTVDDWKLLSGRVQAVVPWEIPQFENALRVYFTKERVNTCNHDRLRDLRRPVININAIHTGRRAEEAESDVAGNLHAQLPLSIGARIMLTENLWVERGLVNGAIGTVEDIIWPCSADPMNMGPPTALIINFDGYDGPALSTGDSGQPLVPIFMSRREFMWGNTPCSRQQFPITVAYAITVHKSQGMTVPRAVLNITDSEFSVGLRYVAVSRVKTLQGVLFEQPFDFEQIKTTKEPKTVSMWKDDIKRRAPQHVRFFCTLWQLNIVSDSAYSLP